MTDQSDNTAGTTDPSSFEDSLARVEEIVHDLEAGSLGLQQSLERFESGMKLLRVCYAVLEDAEQKIEMLTGLSEDGHAETVEFDATATVDNQEGHAKRSRSRAARADTPVQRPANTDQQTSSEVDTDGQRLF